VYASPPENGGPCAVAACCCWGAGAWSGCIGAGGVPGAPKRRAGRNAGEPRGGDINGNGWSCVLKTPVMLLRACLRIWPGPGSGAVGVRLLGATSIGDGGRDWCMEPSRPMARGERGELILARLGRREAS